MNDYKEWSVADGVARFDFSELPPGGYAIRERKIVRLDGEKEYERACDRFTSALRSMMDG
ncbi:hypothetical protein SAMN05216525_107127 [Bradyrhizobium sp. Gha]|nr:hypothetical protein SAMN05216525_107127 [Bradyrhizobium sp. Gha]